MLRFFCKKGGETALFSRCRYFSGGAVRWKGSSSFSVMSFGDGSQGALGLPSSLIGVGGDAFEPMLVPGLPDDIVSVSAGHYHSLAVTAKGELWAWGRNEECQLGRGLLETRLKVGSPLYWCNLALNPIWIRHLWNEPKPVEGLTNMKVRAAFASGVISASLGDDGSVWTWGRSKRGQLGHGKEVMEAVHPSRVKALAEENILKLALGWGHALAQTGDGKLFGWGYSTDGRLGRLGETVQTSLLDSNSKLSGRETMNSSEALVVAEKVVMESMEKEKDMPIIWEPQLIEELLPERIIDVSCGLDHSIVLCGDGNMLSGGSNIYGQLGRENQGVGLLPVDLCYRSQAVACGLGHSVAVCEMPTAKDGKDSINIIVSWGWNGMSQLGRPGPDSQPMVVEGLLEEVPVMLSCGRVHSLAVTNSGDLWAWGCGKNGRLGLGSSFDEPEPALVDIGCHRIVQAVAGFDHNLLLVAES